MEKIFLIVLYFARQARVTKFCGLDLATENFAKFRESMKTVEFFHAAYSFPVMSIGNRGSKIFWIGIESPRGTIFILGGALGRGTFVDFPRRKRRRFVRKHLVSRGTALHIRLSAFFLFRRCHSYYYVSQKTLNNSADSICALQFTRTIKYEKNR